MNKLAVFTYDLANNIDLIERIKSFFVSNHNIDDFIVFTDSGDYAVENHGVLITFYMIAYNGIIVFLNLQDYLINQNNTNNCRCILYLNDSDIEVLDKAMIRNCDILTESEGSLKWIKNYELQKTI
jgi:hypothetical protein